MRASNLGREVEVGDRVVVVGGGGVATDVARSALRHGASEVRLVCLEGRSEMPADPQEVEECEEEGVILHPGFGPRRILGRDGRVAGIETIACISVFDREGRFAPAFDETERITLECDTVILAVGQAPDLEFIRPEDGIKVGRGITVDPETLATGAEGIFAGGDVAHGPRLIIDAIASGRRAALSIARYLGARVEPGGEVRLRPIRHFRALDPYMKVKRRPLDRAFVDGRDPSRPAELLWDEESARSEAGRCLECFVFPWYDPELCILCGACVDVCPEEALRLVTVDRLDPDDLTARRLGRMMGMGGDPSALEVLGSLASGEVNAAAMLKDDDRCIRCGMCADRCPSGAMTMKRLEWRVSPYAVAAPAAGDQRAAAGENPRRRQS